jgi:DNA-damage-inducible protein J
MATVQIRIDDSMKSAADDLFVSLGLDISTAVRMFLAAALERDGLPFAVRHTADRRPNAELREALEDARLRRNLSGPFDTVDAAMQSLTGD